MILSLKHSEMMLLEYALANVEIVGMENHRQIVKILEKIRKTFPHRNDKLFMKFVIDNYLEKHNLTKQTYKKGG